MQNEIVDDEITLLVPLTEDEEVNELIEFFATMRGWDADSYSIVPLSDRDTYEEVIKEFEDAVASYDSTAWILTFDPDLDPTIDYGEPSLPKAVRVIRPISIH